MRLCINSTSLGFDWRRLLFIRMLLLALACIWYAMSTIRVVELIRSLSYARQQMSYHTCTSNTCVCTPKSICAHQYHYQHEFLILFGVLFIHIFMRPDSPVTQTVAYPGFRQSLKHTLHPWRFSLAWCRTGCCIVIHQCFDHLSVKGKAPPGL